MAQQDNPEKIKIKNQFLINLGSRPDDKKVKFTKWINAQSNAQNSFLALIEHMIDRFGYEDITDHEVSRKLFSERLHFNNTENIPVIQQKTQSEQGLEALTSPTVEVHETTHEDNSQIRNAVTETEQEIDPGAF